MKMDGNSGCLIISLDFELLWGGLDVWTPDGYGETNVKNVREAIRRMVLLFEKYNVKATFATVGLLMLNDAHEVRDYLPEKAPSYTKVELNPYGDILSRISKADSPLYFAPEIIEFLKNKTNIEIGTHTFGHYYCWEKGQTIQQFDADIEMAFKVAKKNGLRLESIVFPRNQVSKDYLAICAKYGINTYRGNPKKYFSEPRNRLQAMYYRLSRLLDTYVNWGGNTLIPYSLINVNEYPLNIPASRLLRPYNKSLRFLEPLRLRRVKKEMMYAAMNKELYHIWWHPHNFGAHMDENFMFLENVLKCYSDCCKEYGMRSMTMNEFYLTLTGKK